MYPISSNPPNPPITIQIEGNIVLAKGPNCSTNLTPNISPKSPNIMGIIWNGQGRFSANFSSISCCIPRCQFRIVPLYLSKSRFNLLEIPMIATPSTPLRLKSIMEERPEEEIATLMTTVDSTKPVFLARLAKSV